MKNRTQLNLTVAVQKFAQEHGAYFDQNERAWFVDGDLPGPLVGYAFKETRHRDYVKEVVTVQCQCGGRMILRRNSATGAPFWACAAIKCKATKNFETKSPTEILGGKCDQDRDEELPEFENKDRVTALISLAIELFRNEGLATAWLKSPKVGLTGQTPLAAMKTVSGCNAVERLLNQRFE